MSALEDFGSGLERYGPRHELSGRATKADLRRRIAKLEAERDTYKWKMHRAVRMYRELCSISTADEVVAYLDRLWEARDD